MKYIYIIAIMAIISAYPATAARQTDPISDNLSIIASPTKETVTSGKDTLFYTQLFDVVITNHGDKDVDLEKVSFVANDGIDKKFGVSIIEDKISTGTLRAGQVIKGFIGFSSPDASIYKVRVIHVQDEYQ
ncbi:DUF4354 family protein [Ochrobactrum sp. CM-21-5]|nr:DUF4354 family protein [Ochrobactrum sp. CM-21-5]MBC2883929.1 DUF4354 family protein [Ochrobactrum sp. CM-21-5]